MRLVRLDPGHDVSSRTQCTIALDDDGPLIGEMDAFSLLRNDSYLKLDLRYFALGGVEDTVLVLLNCG